ARLATRRKALSQDENCNCTVFEITLRNASQPGLPPPMARTNAMVTTQSRPMIEDAPGVSLFPEEKTATVDPILEESEKILMDYIGLAGKSPGVIGGK
ncbi:MAG TPA: hypothetical protein VGE41_11845, partial [Verrucomicrobiae bacterium]